MRMQVTFGACLAALMAAPGYGQSFNVDMDTGVVVAGADGVPTDAFGGAAATPGRWNNMEGTIATTITPLLNLNATPSTVNFARSTAAGGSFAQANPGATGDFGLLMNDGQDLSATAVPETFTFSNLAAGSYEVYTYAWAPDVPGADFTSVTVAGSTSTNPQIIGGNLPAPNTFGVGITHALHLITVSAGGSIVVTADGQPGSFGTINGIQIKLIPVGGCPGDRDNDGDVDVDDLIAVILTWGQPDASGVVDVDDLIEVILNWGAC